LTRVPAQDPQKGDEAVADRIAEGAVGMKKVDLFVRFEPTVVQIGAGAALGIVEGKNDGAIFVQVGVGALERAVLFNLAG